MKTKIFPHWVGYNPGLVVITETIQIVFFYSTAHISAVLHFLGTAYPFRIFSATVQPDCGYYMLCIILAMHQNSSPVSRSKRTHETSNVRVCRQFDWLVCDCDAPFVVSGLYFGWTVSYASNFLSI